MSNNNNNNSETKETIQTISISSVQIPNYSKAVIQPVVIFNILDAYMRRNAESTKVMGSLLGRIDNDVIYVENSFSVPYVEDSDKEKLPQLEQHNNLLEIYRKISPQNYLVGWYLTGSELNQDSTEIQAFYNDEQAPLHLLVDTDLSKNSLDIKSFISSNVVFQKETLGAQFLELPIAFQMSTSSEKIALQSISKTSLKEHKIDYQNSSLYTLENSLENLLEMLNTVTEYVDKVVEKKIEGDPKIGRMISNVLSSFPKIDPKNLETMFNNNIQDLLLVVYLANLTKTQVAISEKLHSFI